MTEGVKIGLIIGTSVLVVGGGLAIYFATRPQTVGGGTGGTGSGDGTGTSTDKNKIQETSDKLSDVNVLLQNAGDVASTIGGFAKSLGIGGGKKNETANTETTTEKKADGTLSDGSSVLVKKNATGTEVDMMYANGVDKSGEENTKKKKKKSRVQKMLTDKGVKPENNNKKKPSKMFINRLGVVEFI